MRTRYGNITRLRLELYDMIIDWVVAEGYDHLALKTLAICSIVCRVWSIRARFHLDCHYQCRNAILSDEAEVKTMMFVIQ